MATASVNSSSATLASRRSASAGSRSARRSAVSTIVAVVIGVQQVEAHLVLLESGEHVGSEEVARQDLILEAVRSGLAELAVVEVHLLEKVGQPGELVLDDRDVVG